MKNYLIEAIKEKIEQEFGCIDDMGCYTDNGKWLSTFSLFSVVCEAIEDNSDIFESEE